MNTKNINFFTKYQYWSCAAVTNDTGEYLYLYISNFIYPISEFCWEYSYCPAFFWLSRTSPFWLTHDGISNITSAAGCNKTANKKAGSAHGSAASRSEIPTELLSPEWRWTLIDQRVTWRYRGTHLKAQNTITHAAKKWPYVLNPSGEDNRLEMETSCDVTSVSNNDNSWSQLDCWGGLLENWPSKSELMLA